MGKCSCWGVQDIGDKVAVEGQLVAVATGLVVGPLATPRINAANEETKLPEVRCTA